MDTTDLLTPAEYAALREYAITHGKRRWKNDLWADWMKAAAPGHLQAIRNRLGPSWLARFQFPRGFW